MKLSLRPVRTPRTLRVGALIRQALSEIFLQDVSVVDEEGRAYLVTIGNVRMSADLKLAKIYIVGGENQTTILKILEKEKKNLRSRLAEKINLKFAPEISFHIDSSAEEMARVEALFDSPAVRRDLS